MDKASSPVSCYNGDLERPIENKSAPQGQASCVNLGQEENQSTSSEEVQSIAPVTNDGNGDEHMEGMCPDLGCWRVKLIKTYALLKEEMTKASTIAVADLLYQHDRLDSSKLQSISDSIWRRGMVEELLKWVLIGEEETFEEFMKGLRGRDEETLADTIESVTICTDETEAFKDLELFSLKRQERPINHDKRFNLTNIDMGTLAYYINDKNHIDLLNDKFLSGFHFSVLEHTNICQCVMCDGKRVNTLLATVRLCSETVYPILCQCLHKAKLGHVVTKLECYRQTAKKSKSSQDLATEPSTSTDAKRVDSSIECRLVTSMQNSNSTLRLHTKDQIAFDVDHISNGSIVIQLSPKSTESWKKLEESCESGNIKDLIQVIYSNESIQDLLQEGEYRLQFTIYTISSAESPGDQASSGKKALFHIETDQSSATPPTTATIEPVVPASNPIEDHMDLLVEELEITPGLLEALQDEGMVGSTIKDDVKKAGFRTKKIKYLLEKLSSSGEKGYQALLRSLGKGNEGLNKELTTRDGVKVIDSKMNDAAKVTQGSRPKSTGSHRSIYSKQTFFTGTVVLKVTHSTAWKKENVDPSDSQTKLRITCPEIINPVCHFKSRGPVGRVLHDETWKRWEQSIDGSNLDGIQSLLKTGDLPDNELLGQLCDKEGMDSNIVKTVCDTIGRAMKTDSEQIVCVWSGYRPDNEEQIVFVGCTSVATRYAKPFVVYPLNTFSVIFRGASDFSSEAKDVLHSRESTDKMFTERERQNIRICIQENSKQLMHDHSNLTMISASPVRSVGFGTEISVKKPTTCIVVYLHVKGVVPLSEKHFPKLLKDSRGEVEFPVDVREGGYVSLIGHEASKRYPNLRIGCQIGSQWNQKYKGTLGAFVDLPDDSLGCITCAHVLLSNENLNSLQKNKKEMLEETDLQSVDNCVYQPAIGDEDPIGHVCKVIFRSGGYGVTGVDVALVKLTDEQRHPITGCVPDGDHHHAGFTEEIKMHFSSGEASSCEPKPSEYGAGLLKFGRSSGVTRGSFYLHGSSIRRQSISGTQMNFGFELHDQIECIATGPVFAKPGDSGALVFIAKGGDHQKLKAIGIVEGGTTMTTVLLTPIWEVLNALGLQNKLKVFQHGSIFDRQSNAESPVEATAQCSPLLMCPSSSSQADMSRQFKRDDSGNCTISQSGSPTDTSQSDMMAAVTITPNNKSGSDGLASVIANVSRIDSELKKEMSELKKEMSELKKELKKDIKKVSD